MKRKNYTHAWHVIAQVGHTVADLTLAGIFIVMFFGITAGWASHGTRIEAAWLCILTQALTTLSTIVEDHLRGFYVFEKNRK